MPGDAFWRKQHQVMFRILFPLVREQTNKAIYGAHTRLGLDLDLDWALVNRHAREWATEYTYKLVTTITDTSRADLQSQFAKWVDSGEPLQVLIDQLAPMYGDIRAAAIASTEATRIYAEANVLYWKATGVVDEVRWFTAFDDRVCEICGPIHNRTASIEDFVFHSGSDQVVFAGRPPAHVQCRCWLQPVVNVQRAALRIAKRIAKYGQRHSRVQNPWVRSFEPEAYTYQARLAS